MMPMTMGMMMMMTTTMMVVSNKNHAIKINKKITRFGMARPLLAIVARGIRLAVSLLLIDSDLILFA